MQYSPLGKTGVKVSRLGFGTMSFGGDADETTSRALFTRCRDVGINLFDCADIYADGRSEEILGRLLTGCRDEVVLTTKAHFPTGSDVNARGSSRYHLVRAIEASLRRLQTDRVDVFFLHHFDDQTDLEETLRAVEHLVGSGKVLHPAASNFAAWQVARALGHAERLNFSRFVAIQPMYNLVKRQAEVELLPMAQAEGLAVIPYSPLGGGLLSGKYGRASGAGEGRLERNAMYKSRYRDSANFDVAEGLSRYARAWGVHPATLAIAWVAAHPGVTAPLIGARNLEQLQPCLAAASLVLDDAQYSQISALSVAPPPATDRSEQADASTRVLGAR